MLSNKITAKSIIPLAIFLVIALFLWRGLYLNPHRIASPLIGKPLPDFQAQLLFDGDRLISKKELLGHVFVLNVFATWCISCRAEHAVLMEGKNTDGVIIYGLDYKDSRLKAKNWLSRSGNPYQKIIYDPKGKLAMDLGVYGTPETFIIDRKGIIRYKYMGPVSPDDWKNIILPKISISENF